MFDLMRAFSLAAVTLAGSTNLAKADGQLMDGVKSFICDDAPIVLLKSGTDWFLSDEPLLQVRETRDGWRIGDQGFGFTTYLRDRAVGGWVAEHLSADGFEEWKCIDVTESTARVISAIKPRLDENISEVQKQLATANQELATARAAYDGLQTRYDVTTREHTNNLRAVEARNASDIRQLKSHYMSELQAREAALQKLQNDYDDVNGAYNQLETRYSRLLGGETADVISIELDAILAMSPSARNRRIEETSLGQKGINRLDLVSSCTRTLRDKAKMGDTCREKLIEFLLREGF